MTVLLRLYPIEGHSIRAYRRFCIIVYTTFSCMWNYYCPKPVRSVSIQIADSDLRPSDSRSKSSFDSHSLIYISSINTCLVVLLEDYCHMPLRSDCTWLRTLLLPPFPSVPSSIYPLPPMPGYIQLDTRPNFEQNCVQVASLALLAGNFACKLPKMWSVRSANCEGQVGQISIWM